MSRLRVAACFLAACSGNRNPVEPTFLGSVPSPAFAVASQIATDQVQPPWSLTASDGSGLVLTRVEAKAVLEGPLAFTELHLYFHNAEDRVREGTFAITLPNKAAISRFAMENNGGWMEAEVVEKLKARRAYEDFLHRKQDPALLEKAEGNQFTARVFPIPAKGDKHIVISFSQDLPGERYTLPLRGLPKVERVDARLSLLGADGRKSEQVLTERNWQPDRDFVSTVPSADAVAAGSLVAAQLAVLDPSGAMPAADAPKSMTILVDTSASRTLGFAQTAATLDTMIRELRKRHGDELQLQVVAFDQETQVIFSGHASKWSPAAKQVLLDRGAAGASDLGQAIAWLRQHAGGTRLVVLGDGVITAGAKVDEVAKAIKQLSNVERVDFVLAGGLRDDQVASQLVRASSRPGAVLDADTGVDGVVAALGERMLTDIAIDVRGASWVYPRTIASARPGSRVMVYARMPSAQSTIDVAVNKHRRSVKVVGGTKPLVVRALAATEIGELEIKLANAATDQIPALKAEIAKRSVAARVISSQTALLVLETEADYDRYQIDRSALADILEVGPDGIVTRNRKGTQLQIAKPDKPKVELKQEVKRLDKKPMKLEKESDTKKRKLERLSDKRDPAKLGNNEEDDGDGKDLMKKSLERSDEPRSPRPDPAPREVPPPPPPPPPAQVVNRPPPSEPMVERVAPGPATRDGRGREAWPPKNKPAALQGELAEIAKLITKRDLDGALSRARAWHSREPGNVLAWIGLGETLEARKDLASAARAYGSIIDLFPGRADLRRWAGERLERIGNSARGLAIDTYQRAVADRPDHMTGHRLLAYALLRAGRHADAFAAILAGVDGKYPTGRFNGGDRILREDAGLIAASYIAALPNKRNEVEGELAKRQLALATTPSTRFILYWETDANDVDFHIQDARGGHAFYSHKQLPSGGELFADVTNGYGPECFAIPGNANAGPYRLSIDYYSQGPMGYGMGLLQIVRHDGRGKLAFEDRPYIIMADHAFVDLGSFQ